MRVFLRAAVFALPLFISITAFAQTNDWTIVPGVRVGPIHAGTVKADLKGLFPQSSIEDQELELDEGLVFPSTMIARAVPGESLAIVWNGKDAGAHPKEVFVCRGRRRAECKWRVDAAGARIGVGTKLSELEAMNGAAFTVNGFGWTYGGNIPSWDGGKIGRIDCNNSLALAIDGERNRDGELTMPFTSEERATFEGNRPISSSTAALKKLNPAITEILFIFPAANAKACSR